jgi:ketosteroid isomerase-like protein
VSRTVTRLAVIIPAFAWAGASTALTATTEPLAAVRQYVDAFNNGDVEVMAATCSVPASILDGLAPHVWQGPTACQDWYRDVLTAGDKEDATGYLVILGEPRHVDITGDRAYVVVPATMTFKVHDRQMTQSVSTFSVALQKLAVGWRITAWAWTKGPK